jgi:hypothetical protein
VVIQAQINHVKNDKGETILSPQSFEIIHNALAQMRQAGGPWNIDFKQARKTRTNPQNSYYWGVVIPNMMRGFVEMGNDLDPNSKEDREMIHDFLKGRFCFETTQLVTPEGLADVPKSTTRLDWMEFNEYIDRIARFAAEHFGITIPLPESEKQKQ